MDILKIFWHQVNWKDAVDILLVAFIVYQSLLIIYGTRAVQILLGLLLLMILYVLGNSYDLYALRWILDNFFESLFIITVIIFQSEIRSALASFGSRQNILSPFLKKQTVDPEINEIVEACSLMSKEKIGALIVLSKESGLADYMNTGTRLDSSIHSDLLYAIFQSASPLHDGAAILAKGKLAAVGCLLPLSQKATLDRSWGTRHRAALGITETTDAIAIIVSEERGDINLSFKGSLYSCRSSSELRQHLKYFIFNKNPKQTFFGESS